MNTVRLFSLLAIVSLAAPAAAGVVLTPFRSSQVYVQTSYPTYPYPAYPTLSVYQIASDSDLSSFAGHQEFHFPWQYADFLRHRHSFVQYGTVHGYAIASKNTANDTTYGAARADAIFGDGFVVQNGPANGIATFSIVFEGTLINASRSSFDSSTVTGAWGSLEVSLQENFVGGVLLFDDTVEINRLTQNAVPAPGVSVTFGSLLNSGDSYQTIYNVHVPYQTGKNYFLNADLNVSADKSGTADFLNTGHISNFQVDPAATVVFDSGTPSSAYGAPEPATIAMLMPFVFMVARRRPRWP